MAGPLILWLVLVAVFLAAAAMPFVWWQFSRQRARRRRVGAGALSTPTDDRPLIETLARWARPLARLSAAEAPEEGGVLRRRLLQAGIRHPRAAVLFFGVKTLLALALPLVLIGLRALAHTPMPPQKVLFLLTLCAAVGFYAPNMLLNMRIAKRAAEILRALPDALDLLTLCVEAGLTLDAAVARVAGEMAPYSVALSEELQLLALEFRSGFTREAALKNLARRTAVEDLEALVAMLVQAEKFGTSLTDSLRIYCDVLRHKRLSRAEEVAGRVAVKLIFPLVLCIFPAILLVVTGPAMIRITKMLPTLVGG